MRDAYKWLIFWSVAPAVVAFPSYVACAPDATTEVKVGTVMMGVPVTMASGMTITALRNGAAVTKHIQGELLEIQISGFPSSSAVLVRSDDAANGTLTSDNAANKCASQLATANGATLPGTKTSVSFRPGCTNSTKAIKVQFIACTGKGNPVQLVEMSLEPETDPSTGGVKQDQSCSGGDIPTPPPAASDSSTYTALVFVHRWAVVITWGFLFPLGVSLVRHFPTGSRLKLHRYTQCFGLLLEMISLGCIIAAHQMGPRGDGPVEGDNHFGPSIGSAPSITHKQRGLAVDVCVVLQLILGVNRPKPYPNDFLRRVWMWAHRLIGDAAIVVAWVNIWEAMPSLTDSGTFYSMVLVTALLTTGSAVVAPMFLMLKAVKAEQEQEATGGDGTFQAAADMPRQTSDFEKSAPHFFGCGHCDQVFTERRILEVHHRFTHPDQEYAEKLTPMPKRFAEAMNTPSVNEGVPLSEVMKHNHRHDCWIVLNGKVYDLSNFIDSHPGGPNPILSFAGRDASKAWNLVHQPKWLNDYAGRFEVLGPLACEPPVEGMPTEEVGARRRVAAAANQEMTPTGFTAQASASLLAAGSGPASA